MGASLRVEPGDRLERTWPGRVAVGLAALFLLAFLGVAAARLRYPFALEWIEGGMLDAVRWSMSGRSLYVEPTLEYVPFLYNPLYFWVSGAVARVAGTGFFALRLVSYLASLGAMGLLGVLVARETRSPALGVIGGGAYAGTFAVTEQFMDLARVDALFVFLALSAIALLRCAPGAAGRLAAAAALVLAFLTKQSGALLAAPLVLHVLVADGRGAATWAQRLRGLWFAAAVVAGIGGSIAWLNGATGGWYAFYAFELPRGHALVATLWTDFWSADLMGKLPCACLLTLFALLGPGGMPAPARWLWASALGGALLTSWAGRLHDGGWANVLMPAYAVLAALFAIGLHACFELARAARQDVRERLQVFAALVGVVQLAILLYDPRAAVPSARDRQAGLQLVDRLRSAPGDVLLPADGYLAVMAGKGPHFHEMAYSDIARAAPSPAGERLEAAMKEALRSRRFAVIVTDDDFFADEVVASYERGEPAVADEDAFYPVTGMRIRPGGVFRPR